MSEVDVLDRLARAAGERSPPRGRDDDAVVREAWVVGRARARAGQRRRLLSAGVAALAVAAALLVALPAPAPPSRLVTHRLAGHAVSATEGTALDVRSLGRDVALRLEHGAALFEVAPLAPGHAFVVTTPDATVRVVGTVFSVTVEAGRSCVEVFEGEVEVERGGAIEHLRAGDTSGRPGDAPAELRSRGERAAVERAAHPPPRPPAEPEPVLPAAEPPVLPGAEEPVPVVSRPGRGRELPPSAIDLATLRALCDRGAFAEALAAMDGVTPPAAEASERAMLEGDAARALGEHARAAAAYERSASLATPSRAALAGFLAASSYDRAGDPEAALAVLVSTSAAERGSPLEERALALEARLLARRGRGREAAERARRYLAGFPGGAARGEMERLAGN